MSERTSIAAGSYSDEQIVDWDPFDGERDVDVRCRSTKVVTVSRPHECWLGVMDKNPHVIPKGDRARVERAIVDGEWGAWYACIPCMTAWLREIGIPPDSGGAQ